MFNFARLWLQSFNVERPENANPLAAKDLQRYRWVDVCLLAIVASWVMVPRLGGTHLFDQDEGYYAAVAMEMEQRNDWILPTFNQELFAHKPPLMFWGMRLGFLLGGVGEWGARIFSAIAGIACVVLVYALATRLFDRLVGIFAGMALATNLMFTMVARSATADTYLTLFVTASLACWFWGAIQSSSSDPENPRSVDLARLPRAYWVASYFCMGLAVLTKGPIGFLFPITILGFASWLDSVAAVENSGSPQSSRKSARWKVWLAALHPVALLQRVVGLRLQWGIPLVLLVAGPWYIAAEIQSQGTFLKEFIGVHHLGRFSHAMDNHAGPIYYYAVACLIGLYPWSAFAIPSLLEWLRPSNVLHSPISLRKESQSIRWITSWVAVYCIVFSVATTKLPNYVLPIYPALSIGVAFYLRAVLREPERLHRWQTIAWVCLSLIGATVTLGLWGSTSFAWNGQTLLDRLAIEAAVQSQIGQLCLLGLPLLAMGLLGLWLQRRSSRQNRMLPPIFALASMVFISCIWHWGAPKIDSLQGPQLLAERVHSKWGHEKNPIWMVNLFRPTAVFYSQSRVEFAESEEVIEVADQNYSTEESPILLLSESDWQEFQSQLPEDYQIIERAPNFPDGGELVAVGPAELLAR